MYYFNARWYDQEIGRFISEDPVYDPNNPNLYAYCANNPLKFTDLSGKNIDRKVEELLSRQDDDLANVDVSRREAFFVKQLYDTKDISAKDAVKILNVLKEKGKITNQDLRKLGFDAKNEAGDRITLMYKLAKFETTIKEIEHLESEQRSNDLIFAFALLQGSSSTKSVTINGRKFTEKEVKILSGNIKETSSSTKGIDIITGKIPKDKPIVVIGESMGRVNSVAEQLKQAGFDVKTYNPKNFRSSPGNLNRLDVEANRSWIRYWTQEKGATVIDIGIDPNRTTRSPFYGVEYRNIYQNWNYPNVIKYNPESRR